MNTVLRTNQILAFHTVPSWHLPSWHLTLMTSKSYKLKSTESDVFPLKQRHQSKLHSSSSRRCELSTIVFVLTLYKMLSWNWNFSDGPLCLQTTSSEVIAIPDSYSGRALWQFRNFLITFAFLSSSIVSNPSERSRSTELSLSSFCLNKRGLLAIAREYYWCS